MPTKPQHCAYVPSPKQYGAKAQAPLPIDFSPKLSPTEIKEIQCVIGSILYYAQAVDITVIMALSFIAIEQSMGTTNTIEKAKQLLDYFVTYPDVTIRFCALDMILNVHSDALYLLESEAPGLWPLLHGLVPKGPTRYAPFYALLSLPLPKQNLVPSFSIVKRV